MALQPKPTAAPAIATPQVRVACVCACSGAVPDWQRAGTRHFTCRANTLKPPAAPAHHLHLCRRRPCSRRRRCPAQAHRRFPAPPRRLPHRRLNLLPRRHPSARLLRVSRQPVSLCPRQSRCRHRPHHRRRRRQPCCKWSQRAALRQAPLGPPPMWGPLRGASRQACWVSGRVVVVAAATCGKLCWRLQAVLPRTVRAWLVTHANG